MSESELVRCTGCLGQKKIKGMGMILTTCPLCNGIGWKEKSDYNPVIKNDENKEQETKEEVKITYKKR